MHCINLEYTGRYYLLVTALDKFCHLESLWANGIWYVSSECFFLILLHGNIVALIHSTLPTTKSPLTKMGYNEGKPPQQIFPIHL